MKKLTRKSLDELAKIYPVLSDQEQRGYVAGASPTGSVTGVARDCNFGDCTLFHDPNEHSIPPVVVTPGGGGSSGGGGNSSSGVGTTGNFDYDYYNRVNHGLMSDYINNSNNSNPTTPANLLLIAQCAEMLTLAINGETWYKGQPITCDSKRATISMIAAFGGVERVKLRYTILTKIFS